MIILKSKSNVTNTNYFTTFLQIADMALIFSKIIIVSENVMLVMSPY